jgi:signal transduction histidine kinase
VLDLSRIEAGRVEIVHQPFSLREMNERLVSQTSSLVVGKAFHFSTSIDSALPDRLLGDQDHLEEVLLNLLSNAFKFTAQGEVELRYAYVPDANQWTLSVRDTGIGIPPHALEYIFEEFRQADGSSRRAYGGSGLGLAISRHLCRLMDGDITVQSTVGVGSTFTIKLPFTAAPAEASAEAASTPANSNHGFNGNGTRELVHA